MGGNRGRGCGMMDGREGRLSLFDFMVFFLFSLFFPFFSLFFSLYEELRERGREREREVGGNQIDR